MATVSTKLHIYPSHSFDCGAQLRDIPRNRLGFRRCGFPVRRRCRSFKSEEGDRELEGSRKFDDFQEDEVKLLKGRERSGVLDQLKSVIVACSRSDDGFKASIAKIEEVFSSVSSPYLLLPLFESVLLELSQLVISFFTV